MKTEYKILKLAEIIRKIAAIQQERCGYNVINSEDWFYLNYMANDEG